VVSLRESVQSREGTVTTQYVLVPGRAYRISHETDRVLPGVDVDAGFGVGVSFRCRIRQFHLASSWGWSFMWEL